jgi:hypothetical protein
MTDATAPAAAAPAKPAALWEDFIEIFTSPSTVYERRRDANPWPMILILAVIFGAITLISFNSLSPVYDAEMRAQFTKAMATNPQLTQDMVDTQVKVGMFTRRFGGFLYPVGVLIISLFVWLLGRITGAKELTYTRAMVVFTWASIIGAVALILLMVQGLVMDVSAITTMDKLGFSAARFVDKSSVSGFVYGLLKSLDIFQIWSAIVMGIGARVVGRGTKNTTIAFAVTWIIVSMLLVAGFAARAAM